MAKVSEQDVLTTLKAVIDPDRKADIVGLAMVSGLVVRDGHVGFSIEVDPKRGAALEPLRKAAESAVEKLPGVLSVTAGSSTAWQTNDSKPETSANTPTAAVGNGATRWHHSE